MIFEVVSTSCLKVNLYTNFTLQHHFDHLFSHTVHIRDGHMLYSSLGCMYLLYCIVFSFQADSNLNDLICEYQQHQEMTAANNVYDEEETEEFQDDQQS